MEFFRRYQRTMRNTFIGVVVVSLCLFLLLVRTQYKHTVKIMNERFRVTALSLDYYLKSTTDHVDGLQLQAQDYLSEHSASPTTGSLVARLRDLPGKDYYGYESVEPSFSKERIASITGKGSIHQISPDYLRELNMTAALNPVFRIAKNNLPSAAWVYYTSARGFIAMYPWISPDEFHISDTILSQEFFKLGTPARNAGRKRFWTPAYVDEAGKGLMVTCGAPVYEDDQFRGTVAIDAILENLNQFVTNFPNKEATVFLVNDRNELLAHPTLVKAKDKTVQSILVALPPELRAQIETLFQSNPLETVQAGKHVFFYHRLKNAPWRLVLLAPQRDLLTSQVSGSISVLVVLLLGLTVMLLIATRSTHKEFIQPAERLVSHIENARSDPETPIPTVPEPWRPWFETISDIFRENGKLLEALQQQITVLDMQVEERTREVRLRNQLLEDAMERLKEMQDQIVVQEKMASLGALTAGIAHEIKNPLNFVNNFAELSGDLFKELREVLDKIKSAIEPKHADDIEDILSTLEQNIKKIHEHGKRADSIVRGMLLHSRGKTGERQASELNSLVDEFVRLAYHGLRAVDASFNVNIITEYDPAVGKVDVVPQDLSRAILNIVNNACYAAHEKKQTSGAPDFKPAILIRTRDLGPKVEITIRDNGNGIPADIRDKILNPFFTTKPAGKGTGLGLSITYDIIVQEHRGELRIDTKEGEYAEFTILLPRNPTLIPEGKPQ